jgi:hypothetical protein
MGAVVKFRIALLAVSIAVVVTGCGGTPKVLSKCQSAGTDCVVGDTGPGGGKVFYDAGSKKKWGRYLEVAPSTWNGGNSEPTLPWSRADIVIDGTSMALGAGKNNTARIVAAQATLNPDIATAARAADAYSANGKTDWFLPSLDELKELAKAKNQVDISDEDDRWSSSEANKQFYEKYIGGIDSFFGAISGDALSVFFYFDGQLNEDGKVVYSNVEESTRVLPIRAF